MSKKMLAWEQEAKETLKITPMIDVVFLILIFFMCDTKFKIPEGSLRSYLPRDRGTNPGSPTVTRGCRITIVNEGGQVMLFADDRLITNDVNDELEQERRFLGPNDEELEMHLFDRKRNYVGMGDKGLPVIIDFAEDVPWKYVVQVLNICRRLEIQDVAIAAPELPYD